MLFGTSRGILNETKFCIFLIIVFEWNILGVPKKVLHMRLQLMETCALLLVPTNVKCFWYLCTFDDIRL